VLFSIYLIGILIAVLSSVLFKKLLFAKQEAPFVMELPPYRIPTVHNVVRHMWDMAASPLARLTPIRQSKPSGRIAGSMKCPIRPMYDFS